MKARYTKDRERGGYRYNFRQANGKYTTLRAATVPEMDDLIRRKTQEREALLAARPREADGPTVAEVAEKWYKVASDGLSLNGEKALRRSTAHVTRYMGDRQISDVRPSDIDALLLQLPGKSASLRSKVLQAARGICGYALENGYIMRDPTTNKRAGGKKAVEVQPLTAEQQKILLDAVKGTRAYLYCLLTLRTGLRPEEARGLTWDAVELDAATLTVRQTVIFDGNRAVVSDDPKTQAAKRRIPIPRDLLDAMRTAKETACGDFVICDRDGKPLSSQAYKNLWALVKGRTRSPGEPIRKKHSAIDRPITFPCYPYQLRHTYITELCAHSAETGLDIKTIQYLAGHKDPQITLRIYAHVLANRDAETAAKISAIFD